MGDAMAFDMAARQVDDMESGFGRSSCEIDDADEVAVADPRPRIERGLRLGKEYGIDSGRRRRRDRCAGRRQRIDRGRRTGEDR